MNFARIFDRLSVDSCSARGTSSNPRLDNFETSHLGVQKWSRDVLLDSFTFHAKMANLWEEMRSYATIPKPTSQAPLLSAT